MTTKNVGRLDGGIRILLGVLCIGFLIYNFAVHTVLPLYGSIPLIVLVPFFLKTGLTRECPLMAAAGISTAKRVGASRD